MSAKKYNVYDLSGEYGIGYTEDLSKYFYFDLEDYDKIKDYYWNVEKCGYVSTKTYNQKTKKGHSIRMHKLIMGNKDGFVIDHIYHKTYDNRKSQLRFCTVSQNGMNQKIKSINKYGITGVRWHKRDKRWEAYITSNNNYIYLGLYLTKEEAIKARQDAEIKYFKEFRYKEGECEN